jgi:hypothetical protein
MPDRAWKQEECHAARLLGGTRYPANSGGRVDCESARYVAQVKHVARLSLAELERLAVEMEGEGRRQGKCGLVIVMRRGGRGHPTTRLIVGTERVWRTRGVTLGNCIYSHNA